MARPCRCRRIAGYPDHWVFRADNGQKQEEIFLLLEEYEVLRLLDHEGLTQEECAARMGIARTTVTAIYEKARKKLALFLVKGKTLRISGGAYVLSGESHQRIKEKGDREMRIAVTYDNGLVGQHFGHTEEFKLYDIHEDKTIVGEQILSSNGQGHGMLAGVLKEADVDILLCGGIGMGARCALAEAGIEVLPGTSGDADEAVKALLNGSLVWDPEASCHHHEHEHEDGHECGHGQGCGEHDHGCGGHSCHD